MKNNHLFLTCAMMIATAHAAPGPPTQTVPSSPRLAIKTSPYKPTWESLAKVQPVPEWFRDSKLGIYFHWGVYSVPAHGTEWYPRMIYLNQELGDWHNHFIDHHKEKWGQPGEFGYHQFIPMFKAEKFDAREWAALFKASGARFIGPVAEHHDGFSMWDSKINKWNAGAMGPRRDILGEMAAAAREEDLKVVATFHHAYNHTRQVADKDGKLEWQGYYQGLMANHPHWVDENPDLATLYGVLRSDQYWARWQDKLTEVIDRYQPDLIWFDSWLQEIPAERRRNFLAHYYNSANEWGREVAVARKEKDLPLECSIEDFEKGRATETLKQAWLTDDTISTGSWCWTHDMKVKPFGTVLHGFLDIISKNGSLLLNVSPKADGTIPRDQRDVLLALGDWLKTNGEAVYGTRPFVVSGQGPTRLAKGGHFIKEPEYTVDDIRYTTKGDVLYAHVMGNPPAGKSWVLDAFKKGGPAADKKIKSITLLKGNVPVDFTQDDTGVKLAMPQHTSKAPAVVFKMIR